MAQFQPADIARILREVPVETAIQGIEEAQLEYALTTDALDTLQELAGYFNLISNLTVFGPAIVDQAVVELLRGIEQSEGYRNLERMATRVAEIVNFFGALPEILSAVERTRALVEESLGLDVNPNQALRQLRQAYPGMVDLVDYFQNFNLPQRRVREEQAQDVLNRLGAAIELLTP